MRTESAVIDIEAATLQFGDRRLWQGLDLQVQPGEFLAVLGPNGSGKTSLLKVLLGLVPLSSGTITVAGLRPHRGSHKVGYVPQQKGFDADLGARGRDLVALGVNGNRYGKPWLSRRDSQKVDRMIEQVGATAYADSPIGRLSGGEQQRLRIAQALLTEPAVLLCDEPLLSLDLANQRHVVALIDERRRDAETAVVFVTHELNSVLPLVDRVLYLVDGRWAVGTPAEIMTTELLSSLYGTRIDVVEVHGQLFVVGAADGPASAAMGAEHALPA